MDGGDEREVIWKRYFWLISKKNDADAEDTEEETKEEEDDGVVSLM